MTEVAPFTISRDLKAPVALVFKVNSDPQHLSNWLSPEGFRTIHSELDFRVGGRYHYGLEGPSGMRMWGLQRFLEIVPDRKIVLIQSFSDAEGGLTRHPMSPHWPLEMLSTTTFEDLGASRSRIVVSWRPHKSDVAGEQAFEAGRPGMTGGFSGTFDKLEAYLAKLQG
jgi:uncharacterized protein YndB with AHSA1/START domain